MEETVASVSKDDDTVCPRKTNFRILARNFKAIYYIHITEKTEL